MRDRKPAIATGLCLALSLLAATPWASAFGPEGHALVARLAEERLSPAARAKTQFLLAQEPGATLMSVSSWADETRSTDSYAWHFVNFPRGDCRYAAARDCPGGQCVVAAIERQAAVLKSKADDRQRLAALKYLVHFVADVHQPLHGGFGDDRGGNDWQLLVGERDSNLHALWDSGLLRAEGGGYADWLDQVRASDAPRREAETPAAWAMESCAVVSSAGFYPPATLPADYAGRWRPLLLRRLHQAAERLAVLLERSL